MSMESFGQAFLIFKKNGPPNQSPHEVRGIKDGSKGKGNKLVFKFPEAENVEIDDTIQIKGARDLWRVIELEDEVEDGIFVCLQVKVEKLDAHLVKSPVPSRVIIHNHNSPGANFLLGHSNILQQASWIEMASQLVDSTQGTLEEKHEAKSLLKRISENKLLNTIIGTAVGELTKAALPK